MDGWRGTLKSCGRESMTVSGNCGNDFLQFEVITDEAVVLCPYGERCLWSTCFFRGNAVQPVCQTRRGSKVLAPPPAVK